MVGFKGVLNNFGFRWREYDIVRSSFDMTLYRMDPLWSRYGIIVIFRQECLTINRWMSLIISLAWKWVQARAIYFKGVLVSRLLFFLFGQMFESSSIEFALFWNLLCFWMKNKPDWWLVDFFLSSVYLWFVGLLSFCWRMTFPL